MKFKFEELELKRIEKFNGGEKELIANMYVDEINKILKGKLVPGASIGMHQHATSSEIIFVTKGNGKIICDGKEERVEAGDVHYCKKGSSHTFINDSNEDIEFMAVVPQQ